MTKVLQPAAPTVAAQPAVDGPPGPIRRFLRGRPEDPAWVRRSLLALLGGTGLLYIWGLGGTGWANAFYSAAVQAGASNWEAFFFGSSDAGNSITVDKPPAALWIMDLSVRLFGLSPWSILLPQALMGVATVGVLYLAVRRVTGPGPALIAGTLTALTPVAVLIFRFNNPDALLTLLFSLAAYATTRAVEAGRGRWLLLAGALIGLAFLTKMLQAFLVLPGFALAHLVAAPTTIGRRIGHVLAAGAAMVVAGGWWVAAVQLVPAADRPFIGGSQTNSAWELIWGYNGVGRLNGDETGSVTSLPGGRWGNIGIGRMFSNSFAPQGSWLLPAALAMLVGAFVLVHGRPRTDRTRGGLLVWGGWLVVTWLVLSMAAGIIHPYYTVVLAPAIGAVIGIAGPLLWERRDVRWVRNLLAFLLLFTAGWSWWLLDRSPWYLPWLRWVVLAAGIAATVGFVRRDRLRRAALAAVVVAAVVAVVGAPAIDSWRTAASPHSGALPKAGPTPPSSVGAVPGTTMRMRSLGAMGSLLAAPTHVDPPVRALLDEDAGAYRWVGATLGSENAAGFQLAARRPVLPLGGFNASDPFPTVAGFRAAVAHHRIHWFIGGGAIVPSTSGSDQAHIIAAWVVTHYRPRLVDGVLLYDLSRPPA